MIIVLGATGHVGSAVAEALLKRKLPVTIVSRDAARAVRWQARGAAAAVLDVNDVEALRALFRRGRRAFLLNPPAPPSSDTDAVERRSVRSILAALDGSGLERVVAESTFGAQPGEAIGDLSVLHGFEEGLRAQPIPFDIVRGAYYMSNWDAMADPARDRGVVSTMFPAGFAIPMVASKDIGEIAAGLLAGDAAGTGRGAIHPVEGPARYSAADAAQAFAQALGRPVRAESVPPQQWEETFRSLGFSAPAARSYARMTAATVDGSFPDPASTLHGPTTLHDYVGDLVRQQAEGTGTA